MSATADETRAFELLSAAMRRGFPVKPRDVLKGIPPKKVSELTLAFAGRGLGIYGTSGNSDWLTPHGARIGLEEFHFIQSPPLLAALEFAREARIFTQKSLFAFMAGDGDVDGKTRKLAARLWHLDLVEFRSASEDGEKYFSITDKGRKLCADAADYRVPAFADRTDRTDLSKFHAVLDLEAVRNP